MHKLVLVLILLVIPSFVDAQEPIYWLDLKPENGKYPSNIDNFKRIGNVFDFYWKLGDKDKAKIKVKELFKCLSELDPAEIECHKNEIGITMFNIPDYFEECGEIYYAVEIGEMVFKYLHEGLGLSNRYTLQALLNLSRYYSNIGQKNDAIKTAYLITEENNNSNSSFGDITSSAYNRLCEYFLSDNHIVALECAKNSFEIRKNIYGIKDPRTMISWFYVGTCEILLGKKEGGLLKIQEALNIMKEHKENIFDMYIQQAHILASLYKESLGDYENAIKTEKEVLAFRESNYGELNLWTLKSKTFIAECYALANDSIRATSTTKELYDKYINYISANFPQMTERERDLAMSTGTIHSYFDYLLPRIVQKYYKDNQLRILLFNSILLKKRFLIDYERANNEKYQSFNFQQITWRNLQQQLSNDDIIVEFISFPTKEQSDNKQYAALTLKPSDDSPQFTNLFSEQDIRQYFSQRTNSSKFYSLIWSPIESQLIGVNNVFFSPSGTINSIGIEYLQNDKGELFYDKYKTYRMSSMRLLLDSMKHTSPKTAVLYGGLQYNMQTDDLLRVNQLYNHNNPSRLMRGISDSIATRGSFDPLHYTLTEVNSINKILASKGYQCRTLTERHGTEESVKSLSGQNVGILHLSTHGMYIEKDAANIYKDENNFQFLKSDIISFEPPQEDDVLTRSFLVMSGGDMLAHRCVIPDEMEDGILTALEISQLDLSSTDLVALSACKSGLGDVTNEGVYGLQRGFKKAGAKTILMSLDKVDDEATQILMVEFYRNLMAGKTKCQSLKEAQQYLRKIENGKYDDPKFWASFIMLDGLN